MKTLIIGSGQMGRGIALTLSKVSAKVVISDIKEQQLADAGIWLAKKTDFKFEFTLDIPKEPEFDLIIEAVAENFAIKKDLLSKLPVNAKTIVVSNTSGISINELAHYTPYQENFLGLHFMNPPHMIDLVEIIPSEFTSEKVLKTIENVVLDIGKVFVIAKDYPGFIVNRLLLPFINEAIYLLQEGFTLSDIDVAMENGTKHPLGPLALADLIGLDICLTILEDLNIRLALKSPCFILKELINMGNLGFKNKKGFYIYQTGSKQPNPVLKELI